MKFQQLLVSAISFAPLLLASPHPFTPGDQGAAPLSGQHEEPDNQKTLPVLTEWNKQGQVVGEDPLPIAESTDSAIRTLQDIKSYRKRDEKLSVNDVFSNIESVLTQYKVPIGLIAQLLRLNKFDELEFRVESVAAIEHVSAVLHILSWIPSPKLTVCGPFRCKLISKAWIRKYRDAHMNYIVDGIKNGIRRSKGSIAFTGKLGKVAQYLFIDSCSHWTDPRFPKPAAYKKFVNGRRNPEGNPFTFVVSDRNPCDLRWTTELEHHVPYFAKFEDYGREESRAFLNQGSAFPYTYGFYLVETLVAAMKPEELPVRYQTVPYTFFTLTNLLGVKYSDEDYALYLREFTMAQHDKTDDGPKAAAIKRNVQWSNLFQELRSNHAAEDITAVQRFKRELAHAALADEIGRQYQNSPGFQGGNHGYQGVSYSPGGFNSLQSRSGYVPSSPQQYNQEGGYRTGYNPQQEAGTSRSDEHNQRSSMKDIEEKFRGMFK